jgi:hypothetical protein
MGSTRAKQKGCDAKERGKSRNCLEKPRPILRERNQIERTGHEKHRWNSHDNNSTDE